MRLKDLFLQKVGQTSPTPLLLEVERTDGIYLYGPDGKRYVDLISGVSVSNVGHGNPEVIEAVCAQARKYMHVMVYGEVLESPQIAYADRLTQLLPKTLESVYFVNSGSEAIEGATKLAKRYTGRTELISFRNAYHGSTHGALSLLGNETFRQAFRPLLPDTRILNYNDFEDLEQISTRTACVVIEPVQGEGGVIIPSPGYLEALRKRCTETGTLLIFDEIQTGFGRLGTLFGFQRSGVVPDILCLAKAMGGGMPLGGFAAPKHIMDAFQTNPVLGHITTFGGHPVCCAAGLAALNFLINHQIVEQVQAKSDCFEALLKPNPVIREIRRAGLLIALEFDTPERAARITQGLLDAGLLSETFLFRPQALRIGPPLTITPEEIEAICKITNRIITQNA